MLIDLIFLRSYFWALCVAGLLLYYIYSKKKLYWLSWQLPGPNPALPFIGNSLLLCSSGIKDIFPLIDSIMNTYRSGVVRVWLGPKLMVFVKEPGVARQVNQKTLLKSDEYQYLMKPFVDRGLFNTNDLTHWRKIKKTYIHGLSSENLKSYIPKFHEESLRLVNTFEKFAGTQQSVYTFKLFGKFTLACVTKCIFDYDIKFKNEADIEALIDSQHALTEFFQLRILIPPYRNDFIFTLLGLRAKELKEYSKISTFLKSILDYHKEKLQRAKTTDSNLTNTEVKTFLEHLLEADPTMAEDEIIVHMITMVFAATDTLVTAYIMLLVLLAQNPLVQQKAYEEIVQVLGDDPNICPSVEDLNNLEYLDRVLKECMRMFPAGPINARYVAEDITVTSEDNKTYVFPKGTSIGILSGNIQNNPLYFANPHSFDPDRWLSDNPTKPPPFSYLPFSNGPRNCVGARYALLQMKTMAATVLRNLEVLTSPSCEKFEDIHAEMSMTVRISPNCQVRFRERRKNTS